MKKILLFLVFLFPLFSLGQVSSCKTERIANATTSFGITIPKGDEIIDLNTGNVYLCTTATAGTYTLTTASGNFTLVSFPGFGFTPTTALSGNYRDSIPRGDSLQYVVADTNARNCFVNKKAGMLVYCNANRSLYILLKDTTITRVRRFMNKPSPHYDTLTLIGCNCSTYRPLGYYPTAKCSGDTTYYHNGWAKLYNCWTTYGIWKKISTTDSIPFQYIDNAIIQKVPKDSISFGSSNPQAKLEVDGNIISKGIQWRTISSFIPCGGFGSIWQSIAYGHGIFVAVGYDGGMYSTDGITWTCFPLTGEWENVTYNNGLFVAVNVEGHIAHSSDGVNWSISGYGCIGEAIGMAYGKGMWVIVTADMATSYQIVTTWDAVKCNGVSSSIPHTAYSAGIAYGNGIFVIACDSNTVAGKYSGILTSTDGLTMTWHPSLIKFCSTINFINNQFIVFGDGNEMISSDGLNWTLYTIPVGSWTSITYGAGLYVAVSINGKIMTSTDAIHWIYRSSSTYNYSSVTYGNGLFVALDQGGHIMTSGSLDISNMGGDVQWMNNGADKQKAMKDTTMTDILINSGDAFLSGFLSIPHVGATTGYDSIYVKDIATGNLKTAPKPNSMVYPGSGIAISTGSGWASSLTDNHSNWDAGYSHKTTEDALNGLVKVNGAGVYSAVTDNSSNWNSAYNWGNWASDTVHQVRTWMYDNAGEMMYATGNNTYGIIKANATSNRNFLMESSSSPSWTSLTPTDVNLGNLSNYLQVQLKDSLVNSHGYAPYYWTVQQLLGKWNKPDTGVNGKLAAYYWTVTQLAGKSAPGDTGAYKKFASYYDLHHNFAPLASPTFTGTVTGTFSGNITGNVTGNTSGSSGSCTGNAATVTNGAYKTDILCYAGCGIDSTLQKTTGFTMVPAGYSVGMVVDSIIFLPAGAAISGTFKVWYGSTMSVASGTAVVTAGIAISNINVATRVSSFNNATIAKGNIIWVTCSSITTACARIAILIYGHRS